MPQQSHADDSIGESQELCDHSFQLFGPDRFRDVIIHPCLDAFLAITFQRMRSHGDNWSSLSDAFQSAYFNGCSVPVHLRHLAIHEHESVRDATQGLDCLAPISHRIGAKAQLL